MTSSSRPATPLLPRASILVLAGNRSASGTDVGVCAAAIAGTAIATSQVPRRMTKVGWWGGEQAIVPWTSRLGNRFKRAPFPYFCHAKSNHRRGPFGCGRAPRASAATLHPRGHTARDEWPGALVVGRGVLRPSRRDLASRQ